MAQNQHNGAGLAIASLVLGIVTIVMSMVWFVSILTGILAIIFGALSVKSSSRGKALAGIITGAFGLLITLVVILILFIALPGLQQSQRDSYRKNDVSKLSSQITLYATNHRGALPTVDMMGADDLSLVQTIIGSGDPTTEAAVYTPGEDCDGATSARNYSLTILLESGLVYCVDNS